MNLIVRYPIRFSIPLLLLFLAFVGTVASYWFYSDVTQRVVEKNALDFVTTIMEQHRVHHINDAMQMRNMVQLQLDVSLLAHAENGHALTLIADDEQKILSASNVAWVGQSLIQLDIPSEEGNVLLRDFFNSQNRSQSGTVIVSRDRQSILALTPLIVGDNPAKIGLLYHEHNISALKQAAL